MDVFAELPAWIRAGGWGLISASGLLVGAAGGYYLPLQHTFIARVNARDRGTR
jgi:ZIP family zinc transporter